MWWVALAWGQEVPAVVPEWSLGEALDRLGTDSPSLAEVRARAAQAHAAARQTHAAWLPIAAATATYTRNDSDVVFAFGDLFEQIPFPIEAPVDNVVIQPLEVANGALTARVPLLAPSAWLDTRAAARLAEAADLGADEAARALEAGLVSAAAGAEAARSVVAAAERAAEVAVAHEASTRLAVAAGTATPVDLLAAQADVARRRSEAAEARVGLARADDAVGALLGLDGPARVTLPDVAAPVPSAGPRAAVAAAEARVASAQDRASSAWLRHVPVVSGFGLAQAATQPYPTGNRQQWRVGLEATWTLYDGGLRYGRLDQARAEADQARAQLRAEQLRVSRELRDATRDVALARERLALAEEQRRLAAEAARVAALGLAVGTVSALQSRDADAAAFAAEVGVAAARARSRIADAALRQASGLGQR